MSKYGKGKKTQQVQIVNKKTGQVYYRNQVVGEKEEIAEEKSSAIKYLQQVTSICSGRQKDFFAWQLEKCTPAEISKISTLPEDVQKKLKKVKTELKQCFVNAAKACIEVPGVKYVEGYTFIHGIPLDHAWIKIGNEYFDTTEEFALKMRGGGALNDYASIIELDNNQVLKMASDTGQYGPWLAKKFTEDQIIKKSMFPGVMRQIVSITKSYPDIMTKSSDDIDFYREYADSIVINQEGKLLLLYRGDDDFEPRKWCLPGGKVEKGESVDEACLRELYEETNIFPTGYSFLREFVNDNGTKSTYFEITVSNNDLIILDNNEHYNYLWVDQNDMDQLDLIMNLEERLKEMLPETAFGVWQTNPFGYSTITAEIAESQSNPEEIKTPQEAAYLIIKAAYEKGQVKEEDFLKACSAYSEIQKGKSAEIGDIREWSGGQKMQKTANGWIPVNGGKKGAKKDEQGKDKKAKEKPQHDDSKLEEFAQQSSEKDLKATISNSPDENLRNKAQKELDKRKNKDNPQYGVSEKLKEKVGKWHKKQVEFFQSGELEPESKSRKDLSDLIRAKGKGIVTVVKHEIHEIKHVGSAIKKLFSGDASKITKTEKKALKQVSIHMSMVIASTAVSVATSGTTAVGVAALAKGLSLHYFEHSGLMALGRSLLFAKSEDSNIEDMTDDQLLELLLHEIANHIQSAKISEDDLIGMGDSSTSEFNALQDDDDEDDISENPENDKKVDDTEKDSTESEK